MQKFKVGDIIEINPEAAKYYDWAHHWIDQKMRIVAAHSLHGDYTVLPINKWQLHTMADHHGPDQPQNLWLGQNDGTWRIVNSKSKEEIEVLDNEI